MELPNPRELGSNAKKLGLKHLQFPDMRKIGGLPEEARVAHHR